MIGAGIDLTFAARADDVARAILVVAQKPAPAVHVVSSHSRTHDRNRRGILCSKLSAVFTVIALELKPATSHRLVRVFLETDGLYLGRQTAILASHLEH